MKDLIKKLLGIGAGWVLGFWRDRALHQAQMKAARGAQMTVLGFVFSIFAALLLVCGFLMLHAGLFIVWLEEPGQIGLALLLLGAVYFIVPAYFLVKLLLTGGRLSYWLDRFDFQRCLDRFKQD